MPSPRRRVRLPLAMLNRHGLVAGATGTGKTKTLQVMAEQLSAAGVPVFISRHQGRHLRPRRAGTAERQGHGPGRGHRHRRLRAAGVPGRVPDPRSATGRRPRCARRSQSFGPILLAKVLELNETQQSVLALVFKYAEDNGPRRCSTWATCAPCSTSSTRDEGKAEMEEYGGVATATVGVMIRKIVELEQQDADAFFGAPEFDVADLMRTRRRPRASVSVPGARRHAGPAGALLDLHDVAAGQLFTTLPEVGDLDKPKLVFFFDEAHLLFATRTRRSCSRSSCRAADPIEGRGRVLRHPAPDRRARRGAGPARQPGAARAARLHAR